MRNHRNISGGAIVDQSSSAGVTQRARHQRAIKRKTASAMAAYHQARMRSITRARMAGGGVTAGNRGVYLR